MATPLTPSAVATLVAQGRAVEAVEIAAREVRNHPKDPAWMHVYAYALHSKGDGAQAAEAGAAAVSLAPHEATFRNTLGAIELERGRLDAAQGCLKEALRLRPDYAEARFNLAQVFHRKNDLPSALEQIDAILAVRPDFMPAHLERAKLLLEQGDARAAMPLLEELLRQLPDDARVLLNAAAASLRLDQAERARALLERAVAQPRLSARDLAAAAETFALIGDMDQASRAARAAASHVPVSPHVLRLAARGGGPGAIAALQGQLRVNPASRDAHFQLALALETQGEMGAARSVLARAVAEGHDDAQILSSLVTYKARACEWLGLDELVERLKMRAAVPTAYPANPGIALYLDGVSAMEQRVWSENWAAARWPNAARPGGGRARRTEGRIRVGFLSADFREHPTARLIVAAIEAHDRDRFEFVAYSHRASDGSPIRARLEKAFDRIVELADVPDAEATRTIERDDLDVLLDMGGHVRGSRLDLLAHHPARVQGHFLGYPATTGAPFVDFFVTDAIASPPGSDDTFTERLLRMPVCCQPTDPLRELPDAPSRASCGLPERALVLCCFNQPIKITASVFKSWCRLLEGLPEAVLWLLEFEHEATANLVTAARQEGIDPSRVIFAPRVHADAHLARLRNADIALDAYPCTSHTTASDAIWAGVPLLTTFGETFASRMASSVLAAAGLGTWCFASPRLAFEATIALARTPGALQAAKARVAGARSSRLFDAASFAKDFESLLLAAVHRQ